MMYASESSRRTVSCIPARSSSATTLSLHQDTLRRGLDELPPHGWEHRRMQTQRWSYPCRSAQRPLMCTAFHQNHAARSSGTVAIQSRRSAQKRESSCTSTVRPTDICMSNCHYYINTHAIHHALHKDRTTTYGTRTAQTRAHTAPSNRASPISPHNKHSRAKERGGDTHNDGRGEGRRRRGRRRGGGGWAEERRHQRRTFGQYSASTTPRRGCRESINTHRARAVSPCSDHTNTSHYLANGPDTVT